MTYFINKTEARAIARADLTIFNETQALMKQVITDASNGLYDNAGGYLPFTAQRGNEPYIQRAIGLAGGGKLDIFMPCLE